MGSVVSLYKSISKKIVEINVTTGKSIPKVDEGFTHFTSNSIIDFGTITNNMSPTIEEDYGLVIIRYLQNTSLSNNYIYLTTITEY